MVQNMPITILTLNRGEGPPPLRRQQPVQEVENLKVKFINENQTYSNHDPNRQPFHRPIETIINVSAA